MSLGVPGIVKPGGRIDVPAGRPMLKKGRSLMDWIRLSKAPGFVRGDGGGQIRGVTMDELSKHNTADNGWIALGGMVYNVTAYMDFHPGGVPELERGLGKDATALFDEVHRWVNFQSMLAPCLIGKLLDDIGLKKKSKGSSTSVKSGGSATFLSPNGSVSSLKTSQLRPPSSNSKPRYEWFQSDLGVTLRIFTRLPTLRPDAVRVDVRDGNQLEVTVGIDQRAYRLHLKLEDNVHPKIKVTTSRPSGVAELSLHKLTPGRRWAGLGSPLEGHEGWEKTTELPVRYRCCTLTSKEAVTHDTYLLYFSYPSGVHVCVPTGHHVHIRATVQGVDVCRSYTAVTPDLGRDLSTDDQDKMAAGVTLMIKMYQDGALTPELDRLQIGDTAELSDPEGTFSVSRLDDVTSLCLVAAGTGFTPMVGLLQHVLYTSPRQRDVKINLLFFNKKEIDILWQEKLDNMTEKHDNLRVVHVLSQAGSDWSGLRGRVRAEIVAECVPAPLEDDQSLVCVCGPTPFTNESIRLVKEVGYSEKQIHAFLA